MKFNKEALIQILDQELVSEGFKRKGRNWYKTLDDCVQVLNLQKSPWGGQYYINLGILMRDLDSTKYPSRELSIIPPKLSELETKAY